MDKLNQLYTTLMSIETKGSNSILMVNAIAIVQGIMNDIIKNTADNATMHELNSNDNEV